jgi:nucleoside diphosphate kinase
MPISTKVSRNGEALTIPWTWKVLGEIYTYFEEEGYKIGSEYQMTFKRDLDIQPYDDGTDEDIVHIVAGDVFSHWR